jgi:hypothetical protein
MVEGTTPPSHHLTLIRLHLPWSTAPDGGPDIFQGATGGIDPPLALIESLIESLIELEWESENIFS